jgi:hypothetical protein
MWILMHDKAYFFSVHFFGLYINVYSTFCWWCFLFYTKVVLTTVASFWKSVATCNFWAFEVCIFSLLVFFVIGNYKMQNSYVLIWLLRHLIGSEVPSAYKCTKFFFVWHAHYTQCRKFLYNCLSVTSWILHRPFKK